MPRYPIDRATNFIVEEESWTVVEYDHTSVPGVIYLSLTEGKINSIYDDVENNVADTDKLAKYNLDLPALTQIFHLGDHINPVFTLTKNGAICNEEIEWLTDNKKIVRNIDGELIAVGRGTVNIIAQLKNYPEVKQTIEIIVGDEEQQFTGYIEGPDNIRLDRKCTYKLVTTPTINNDSINYTIDDLSLASFESINNNECIIRANAKNKLGSIVLTISYNDYTFTKEIKIIPLW